MNWVRIHPVVANWPGGGPPPVFNISADENGAAVVELAWDPQALLAPASYAAPDGLRYYASDVPFTTTITDDSGASRSISVPAQTIQLTGNRAVWTVPQALWDGYVQESLKSLRSGATRFQCNLYYRVRVTAPGSSTAISWPAAAAIRDNPLAPHIGILRISATPGSTVTPDDAAVAAMGGISIMPTLWGDMLRMLWMGLPESDPGRQALVQIFAHAVFKAATVANRAKLLKLWLLAGPTARPRLAQLLGRQVQNGSAAPGTSAPTVPVIEKRALVGSATLLDNLLGLLDITPHPDLVAARTTEQLLDDVLTEILDPNGQINQGNANTCTTTSIQTLLINVNPAEYARLQRGLLSSAGSAQLAAGQTVTLPPGAFKVGSSSAFSVRTYAELGFQATVLRHGMGARFPDVTTIAGFIKAFQDIINEGLFSHEIKRALDGVFNRNHTTHFVFQSGESTLPITTIQSRQPTILADFLRDRDAWPQPLILDMWWGTLYGGGHAVVALRHENGRIFFKNPQYAGSNPSGTTGSTAANPPRRYDDSSATLESMTEADLGAWVRGYWMPDGVIG